MNTATPFQRNSAWLVIVVGTLAACGHLALTWLYNSPDNIAKITYDRQITGYFGQMLYQNWSFFAPNPIDQDTSLYARARDLDGKQTAWVDVTGPLLADLHRNRLSSYEFISTSVMNAVLAAHNDLSTRRSRHDTSGAMSQYHFRSLYRTGASVLRHLFPQNRFASIEIGLYQSEYPRFTHRTESNDRAKTALFPLAWEAFPNDVDSTGW